MNNVECQIIQGGMMDGAIPVFYMMRLFWGEIHLKLIKFVTKFFFENTKKITV